MSGLASSITAAQASAVALGAAVDALLRWWAGLAFNGLWAGFPLGTLLVNAVGGLLIGVAMVWFTRSPHELLRLLLVTGLLGGFTTFSAFSLDAVLLWERGETMLAATYVIGSVVLSLAALVGGLAMMRSMS